MSHAHTNTWRPRKFRTYCINRYWANRDEYDQHGQTQPYTFDEYVQQHLSLLKHEYRSMRTQTL